MSELFDDTELDSEFPQDTVIDLSAIPFVQIPIVILQKLGKELGPLGITTYIGIRSHANRQRGMTTFVLVKTIADELSMGESTVRREIARLESLGLISRQLRTGRSTVYTVTPPLYLIEDPPLLRRGDPSTIERYNQKNSNQKKLTTPPASDSPMTEGDALVVQGIFDHFVEALGKSRATTLTPKRLSQGKKCLQHARTIAKDDPSAVELMKQVVGQLAESDFHNARGKYQGGTKYNDWEQVFGSIDRFQKWVERTVENGN